jgi:hypothetical protein
MEDTKTIIDASQDLKARIKFFWLEVADSSSKKEYAKWNSNLDSVLRELSFKGKSEIIIDKNTKEKKIIVYDNWDEKIKLLNKKIIPSLNWASKFNGLITKYEDGIEDKTLLANPYKIFYNRQNNISYMWIKQKDALVRQIVAGLNLYTKESELNAIKTMVTG